MESYFLKKSLTGIFDGWHDDDFVRKVENFVRRTVDVCHLGRKIENLEVEKWRFEGFICCRRTVFSKKFCFFTNRNFFLKKQVVEEEVLSWTVLSFHNPKKYLTNALD